LKLTVFNFFFSFLATQWRLLLVEQVFTHGSLILQHKDESNEVPKGLKAINKKLNEKYKIY